MAVVKGCYLVLLLVVVAIQFVLASALAGQTADSLFVAPFVNVVVMSFVANTYFACTALVWRASGLRLRIWDRG